MSRLMAAWPLYVIGADDAEALVVARAVGHLRDVDLRRHPEIAVVRVVLLEEVREDAPARQGVTCQTDLRPLGGSAGLETAQAFADVGLEALAAELAVARDVDADFGLLAHHVLDALADVARKLVLVVRSCPARAPSSPRMMAGGRTRLPTWVVRMRSVLRFKRLILLARVRLRSRV